MVINTVDTLDILINDKYCQSFAINLSLNGSFKNGSGSLINVNGKTELKYIPNTNFVGLDSILYTLSYLNTSVSDTAWVYIAVHPLNEKPIAQNDYDNAIIGTSVTVAILNNDSDPDLTNVYPEGFILTPYLSGSLLQPQKGTIVMQGNNIIYTPFASANGIDSFQYVIKDNGRPTLRDTGTVYITIDTTLSALIARPDYATTTVNTAVLSTSVNINIHANDYSPINPVNTLISTAPSHGVVNILASGWLNYIPTQYFVGKDTLIYNYMALSGANTYQDTAMVIITVTPLNQPIVALDDSVYGRYGVPLRTVPVTLNDYDNDDNIASVGNMSTATVFIDNKKTSILAQPTQGTIVLNNDNSFTWTPHPNNKARGYLIDSFQYVITDNYDATDMNTDHAEKGECSRDTAWVFISVGQCDLVVDAGHYQVVCPGNAIQLGGSNTATGGFGTYTYYWTDASNTITSSDANPTFTFNQSTVFTLQVFDESGCRLSDTVSVVVKNTVPAQFTIDSIFCTGASPVVLQGMPTGGTFSGAGISTINGISQFNPASITIDTPIAITYNTIQNGCYVNASHPVVVHHSPVLNVGANQLICPQMQLNTAQLYVAGADSFVWSPASSLNNANVYNPIASPTAYTVYTVIGYKNGCSAMDSVIVDVCKLPSQLSIDAFDDSTKIRMNQSVNVYVAQNDTSSLKPLINYQLTQVSNPAHGSIQLSGAAFNYTPANNFVGRDTFQYQICIRNGDRDTCDIANVYITVRPIAPDYWLGTEEAPLPCLDTLLRPAADLQDGVIEILTMPTSGTAWVDSIGFIYYQGGNPDASLDSIVYQVTVNGLSDIGVIYIYSNCTPPVLPCMIPDGFSPNNDNVNDYFYIDCIPQYPNSRLTVYNRWGNSVHNTAPYQNNWDGKYNGQDLPDGTYFYILQFNDGITPNKLGYLIIHR
jgi:gliding motility-associated-like protein